MWLVDVGGRRNSWRCFKPICRLHTHWELRSMHLGQSNSYHLVNVQLGGLSLSKQHAGGNNRGVRFFSILSIFSITLRPFKCLYFFSKAMAAVCKPRSYWSVGWWKERPPTGNSPNAVLSKFAPRSTPPGTSTQLGRRVDGHGCDQGTPVVLCERNDSVKISSMKITYIE